MQTKLLKTVALILAGLAIAIHFGFTDEIRAALGLAGEIVDLSTRPIENLTK